MIRSKKNTILSNMYHTPMDAQNYPGSIRPILQLLQLMSFSEGKLYLIEENPLTNHRVNLQWIYHSFTLLTIVIPAK